MSSFVLFFISNVNFSQACNGVKFSKAILFLAISGISVFISSTFNKAKYLSPSLGGRIFPFISSPVLKLNFFI
jgi:hypothetical protein